MSNTRTLIAALALIGSGISPLSSGAKADEVADHTKTDITQFLHSVERLLAATTKHK
jgi:hypothetical protein